MGYLSPSNLETLTYASPAWNFVVDKNFELLAKTLLKFNALFNVDSTGLVVGASYVWNASVSKWQARVWS